LKPVASEREQIFRTFSEPLVKKVNKKPIIPTEEEMTVNPRSRSAKLRTYIKLIK
jgi:16S rRNA C1402 N4-methylase RsmH